MKKIVTPKKISVSLVIPIFNNEKTLFQQIKQCQKMMKDMCDTYEIVISNDASTDKTKEKLILLSKDKHIRVYHQPKNLGIADNLKFLYKKARYSYILLYSVDGDWNPLDISRLITAAKRKKSDIVIGMRRVKDYSFMRKFVSFVYNKFPILFFNINLYDIGSIKIFKKEIFSLHSLQSKSVFFEAEMFIKAVKKNYIISAIPVNHRKHKDNKRSTVNISLIMNSLYDLLKLRVQNL